MYIPSLLGTTDDVIEYSVKRDFVSHCWSHDPVETSSLSSAGNLVTIKPHELKQHFIMYFLWSVDLQNEVIDHLIAKF